VELFLTVVVTGLTLGLVYALFATGLGLVLRTSGELNLAHGDSLMLGTYVGLGTLSLSGVRPLAVLGSVVASALIGTAAYVAVYAPVTAHHRAGMAGLGFLPALGVALVVRNVATEIDPDGSRGVPPLVPGDQANLYADSRLPGTGWSSAAKREVP
jgi:branched-chain amino acid transport system permease protein